LFVEEKELFPSGEDKLTTAICTRQKSVHEFHAASPVSRNEMRPWTLLGLPDGYLSSADRFLIFQGPSRMQRLLKLPVKVSLYDRSLPASAYGTGVGTLMLRGDRLLMDVLSRRPAFTT
jgi:hypothetical protein